MTTSKRSLSELERSLRAVEEEVRVRDEFLRLAGHELRSPLTAVQLQTDTLTMLARQGAGAQALEERAEKVKRAVHRLAWVVEEVLDLGRASGAGLPLLRRRANLVEIARRVLDRFADDLGRAGCQARLVHTDPVEGTWDAPRVEHALGSVLLAAIKGSAGAAIDVEVTSEAEGAAAVVAVRHGGPGLPPEQSALVFGSFDRMLAGLKPGMPVLGLWLARAVAEGHGGVLAIGPGLGALRLPKTGGDPPGLIGENGGPP
jgi:signal transduction histidine kinase